jgi:opacity protein-like surface antigen
MKIISRNIALLSVSSLGLFLLPASAHSQGFYFNANAGVSFADDVDLRQFLVSTRGTELEFDPGGRLSAAGGYNFNAYIGVQLETGFIFNNVKGVSSGGDIDAVLSHVPMLADVVLRYDKSDCQWVPYIGAGIGGDISSIALDDVRAPNGALVDGSDSDIVFAWQAFAGLRYKFMPNMSIGAGYKFYYAGNATWDVENSSGDIKTGKAQVHSFGVDFTMTF